MNHVPLAPRRGLGPVTLQTRRASWWQRVRGWAAPDTRVIRVYWHPFWTRAQVEQAYLHEMAHLSGLPGCVGHGKLFKSLVVRKAREALGVHLPPDAVSWSMADLDWGIVWRSWWQHPENLTPCWSEARVERWLTAEGASDLAGLRLDAQEPVQAEGGA